MIKTFKYKLKPTKKQAFVFDQWLSSCRFVYNLVLSYKIDLYKSYGLSLSKYNAQKELTEIRNQYDWIGQIHSQTLQSVTDRLFLSYDKFFKQGAGFPRFAKKGFYSSFDFKQGVSLCVNTNKIKLPSIGKVSYYNSRPIEGIIKKAIIKKEIDGWYISLACEIDKPTPTQPLNEVIGIDLGIKHFAVLSNGEKIDNPKHYRSYEKALAQAQRALSRKKKGSNNKKKEREKVARIHLKIKNTRKDFLHKISSKIISENQVIILEDLQVKNMVKNHCLSKSISDAGWGMFKNMLQYKAELNDRRLILVPPHNTSKACSCCGLVKEDMDLSVREWVCAGCGALHDRDVNASKNILTKGLVLLAEQGHCSDNCGGNKRALLSSFDMATQ